MNKISLWFSQHLHAGCSSIKDMIAKPLSTIMTIAVIGFAIALPAGFYLILQNLQVLNQYWDNSATVSLYLEPNLPMRQVDHLFKRIGDQIEVAKVQYISPEAGLNEFAQTVQIQGLEKLFPKNPLPPVIVVTPKSSATMPDFLEKWVQNLKHLPGVETVQIDLQWIKRFYYILQMGNRLIAALAILFGLGVVLIICNTIRLIVESHHHEMMVWRLIGAPKVFYCRPLLYRGLWYALLQR